MKKSVLLLSFMLLMAFGAFSQSILFFDHEGNAIDNGSTIELVEDPSITEILFEMNINNSTSDSMSIFCKKVYLDVMDDTMNTFCWGMCFGPTTFMSTDSLTLAAGETTNNGVFSGHYMPMGVEGPSTIQYVFFDAANPNDSSYVTVKYVSGFVGINNTFENNISEVYPNPATEYGKIDFNINYKSKASIIVNDLTGSRVKEVTLDSNSGTAVIEVNDLFSGIYFYTIIIDGEAIKTGKLVVR